MLPTYKVTETTTFYNNTVVSSQNVVTRYYDSLYEAAKDYDSWEQVYRDEFTTLDTVIEFAIYKNDKVIESFVVDQQEEA